uniref:PKcGMP_CC domain-containing protein n=1 Tax=Rhodnius prolixus TaxID=13249 RepID=T1HRY5_RHOPR
MEDMSRASSGALAGSVEELEARVRLLEAELKKKDEEILELKSHLDKFQSVFPFHMSSPTTQTNNNNNNNNNSYYNKGEVVSRPRKQRAQGISAEPQDITTIQELANQKFPVISKNDRPDDSVTVLLFDLSSDKVKVDC